MSSPESAPRRYLPREHGATAMTLTPILCAAILARTWRWQEIATLCAAFAALAIKDPVVVLLKQRFVWKQANADTPAAQRWFLWWFALLAASGLALLPVWPLVALVSMGAGIAVFCLIAVLVNVRNRQRSVGFQILSAAALTSSALATSLSATGTIPAWCWKLLVLLAVQATVGILVVHARLDARIALRAVSNNAAASRKKAVVAAWLLMVGAAVALLIGLSWVAAALAVAALGYLQDLAAQREPENLTLPLKTVGLRSLALASAYALLLVVGLR